MGNFYLDIETTGLDEKRDKIVTIQYQPLDRNTAKAAGALVILKEWESSEKEILEKFIRDSRINDEYPFTFVPTGYNLGFEHNFLHERCIRNGLPPVDILNKPFIDLRACGVIMNRGEFKGSGLDKITGKPQDGSRVPEWYKEGEYGRIIDYVTVEAREFVKFAEWLYRELPETLNRFRKENRI